MSLLDKAPHIGITSAEAPVPTEPDLMPLVHGFIPSIAVNYPFRISIHNWHGRPEVSRACVSAMNPGDTPLFEARVYIDGYCVQ
jgi:hypothetical protein